jgi:hypothetical protein
MGDLIDRQAAIDEVERWLLDRDDSRTVEKMLMDVPSAQSEPLTDKEQRIFLTAMAREEKVCRQVDDECRDITPYEVSLVHVCKEIRRKVKGALWT